MYSLVLGNVSIYVSAIMIDMGIFQHQSWSSHGHKKLSTINTAPAETL